jgi:hypothetical protein
MTFDAVPKDQRRRRKPFNIKVTSQALHGIRLLSKRLAASNTNTSPKINAS